MTEIINLQPMMPTMREFNKIFSIFDEFCNHNGAAAQHREPVRHHGMHSHRFSPPTHRTELPDGTVQIEMALAGYSKDNLNISVQDNVLTVSAQKIKQECSNQCNAESAEATPDNPKCLTKRAFKQDFPDIEGKFDLASTQVSYRDGLLTLCIPPKHEPEPEIKIISIN